MLVLEDESVDGLFARLSTLVLRDGVSVSPRGIPTREVGPVTCTLTNPRRRIVTAAARRINPAFMFADALYLLAGSDDDWIFDYNQRLREYTDGGRLRGAYGPRLRAWRGVDQLSGVRDRLQQDPSSRRACVVLYDPERDFGHAKDIPCTVAIHFIARHSRLAATTFMRSQDLWLGFPYDLFNFTLVQEVIASSLGLELGPYTHVVSSLHFYARDFEKAGQSSDSIDRGVPSTYPVEWTSFGPLMTRLVAAATGQQTQIVGTAADDGWLNLEVTLHAYRAWKKGHVDRARELAGALPEPLRTLFARFTNVVVKIDRDLQTPQ